MIVTEEDYLAHYGVMGMHWGKHKMPDDDVVIKKGTTFQRIVTNANSGYTKGVYVSYKNADKDLYKGVLGRMRATTLLKENGDVSLKEIKMTAKRDIRLPSKETRLEEFKKLYEKDPKGVLALINDHEKSRYNRKGSDEFDSGDKKRVSTMYEKFNDALSLGTGSPHGKTIQKYYSQLSKLGYDAIPDENDIRLSTFKAQAPIIMFNTKKSIGDMTVRELSASEIYNAYNRAMPKKVVRGILQPGNSGKEKLPSNSSKEIEEYARKIEKDKFSLNSKYTLKDLAEDWNTNGLSAYQIKMVSGKMDEGKTHEQAVKETMMIGNVAVSYILNNFGKFD